MHEVIFTRKAEKELKKLTKSDIIKVLKSLKKLESPFFALANVKKLVNVDNYYRLRVGKIRAIFSFNNKKKLILIEKVAYRGQAYRF